ncbi:MAG: hypothetical protein WC623_09420 [Pedobacter sp.]|uniref:hypothetical protein n=1 Tax=Pedobacter sp. TaxID=1411316 RepID=UPI0035676F04
MEKKLNQDQLLSRRKLLTTLGIVGATAASGTALGNTGVAMPAKKERLESYGSVVEMLKDQSLKEGALVQTYGYYNAGDGGATNYKIEKAKSDDKKDIDLGLKLNNGLIAVLINVQSVNYKMFGAVGDGVNDDSIQIKAAHDYANAHDMPVINFSGEYWLKKANNVEIYTNVDWGSSIFHIDETTNTPGNGRFKILPRKATIKIELSESEKKSFLSRFKPGVKVIPELAAFKNCLVNISDKNDKIGFRAGAKFDGQSWAREELFYVEEHGSIIGDIAWSFKDYTTFTAFPADTSYLTVNGGTFYLSGDSPGTKYVRNGFAISRSRTIIQNQWVGLEPGKSDISMSPRSGFYSYSNVYDVKLENIRLIPYEQDREGTARDVSAGTYGIGGARILNALFRNITAEGGPIHWGVFGTNLNKNFRVENCKLNRIDVHFHCWNLYIKDSSIGYRGISVTGGGDLSIENTSCFSRSFINFRRDFGSKWDGNILMRNCRFIPSTLGETSVLDFNPQDFDYKYPLGFGRSIIVENLLIDFNTVSDSVAACWLMKTPNFSKTKSGHRLFFPNYVEFRNVMVQGREQGVRLFGIINPQNYQVDKVGGYDGAHLNSNSQIVFNQVQLEDLSKVASGKIIPFHFVILGDKNNKYEDQYALYPEIRMVDCKNVVAMFGDSKVDVAFDRCSLSSVSGTNEGKMPGRFTFNNCLFRPTSKSEMTHYYLLKAELGTSLTNCTISAPVINGMHKPEQIDRFDIIVPNKTVRYNHLNTQLGNDIIAYYKQKGLAINPKFISMLKSHHQLEAENI